jgi:threonine dehydrogenase-like Zn-dependent dehydrogenase
MGASVDGALAEYIKVPASTVIPIGDDVDLRLAQSLDSLSCSVNAIEKLDPGIGDTGLLFGVGHSGLLIEQVLCATAIGKLGVVGGSRQFRMDKAKELGADLVIASGDENFDEVMKDFLPEEGADFIVEASGSLTALKKAAELLKPGGTLLTYGLYKFKDNDFDFSLLYRNEITIKGCRGAGDCDNKALALLRSKKVNIEPLITHDLKMENCEEGFRMMSDRQDDALRIVFEI